VVLVVYGTQNFFELGGDLRESSATRWRLVASSMVLRTWAR
jgi:hypothetical protein